MTQRGQSIYLFKTEGSSDKEYHLHLRAQPDGAWRVDYANGRRGAVAQSKVKTQPTSYELALAAYLKVVKEKKKDGYTESESGERFSNTEDGREVSPLRPQLSVPVDAENADRMVGSHSWFMQQKANGERRMITVQGDAVRGINKLGLFTNIPESWVAQYHALGDCIMDGEQVGQTYYVFDLLQSKDIDLRGYPFSERYARLVALCEGLIGPNSAIPSIKILTAFSAPEDKRRFLNQLQESRQEGVVFKSAHSAYSPGRDEFSLKYKFVESCTLLVAFQNAQRSVKLAALNERGEQVPMGNVTIPANHHVPAVGEPVEIQYLYFNPHGDEQLSGGALEQPVYLGARNDILPAEATLAQITRYKPVDAGVDEDEQQGGALQLILVALRTPDLCAEAVKQNPDAVEHVPASDQSESPSM